MILDRLSVADRVASVEIDADGVQERQERDTGEEEGGKEGEFRWLGTEVEDCNGDGADVD